MKKWSRKKKLLLWLLVLLFSTTLLVCIKDFPSLTPEMAMRRAEKRSLIGPCQIIGNDYIKTAYDFDYMALVGESQYGYTLFEYMQANAYYDQGFLSYHEKQDGFTLFCSGSTVHYSSYDTVHPFWVFPPITTARSAVLTLTCSYNLNNKSYERTYTLEAQRNENGYFLFIWDYGNEEDRIALDYLFNRINGKQYVSHFQFGTATLELYDSNGQLLDTLCKEYPSLR